MKPLLTFFFDALKPESVSHMPFLNSLPYKSRLRTELGYSVTCHPSMYSGVHLDKHLQWFVWKYAPATSPFGWAKAFQYLGILDNLGSRYFLHKYTRQYRKKNTAWFGVPLLVNLPLKYWPLFDVVEDRSWDEPGYLRQYPTVFDLLREQHIDFEVIGMKKGAGDELAQIGPHTFTDIKPWTYFFLGSLDHYSHQYVQESPQTVARMEQLDRLVQAQYEEYSKRVSDFDVLVFSDHGHIAVKKRVNIHEHFRRNGHSIHQFINLVEANYARFWFRNDRERSIVERILSSLEGGFILRDQHLDKYHVRMPDNRFGDLVYYLDAPAIFSKTIWGFGRTQNSMHGYLPDYPESDGVIVTNRPLVEQPGHQLVDILPTILSSLDVAVPPYVDGCVLWSNR